MKKLNFASLTKFTFAMEVSKRPKCYSKKCKDKEWSFRSKSLTTGKFIKLFIISFSNLNFSWLTLTDPADVARVESKTFISTERKRDTIPITADGVQGSLGNWMSPDDTAEALNQRFPGCMKGRTST